MNLHMTGHHLEITPSIRDYVNTKMIRINRHFDHVIDVNMILSVEKLRQKIEANVHLSGKDIFAESENDDMYAAIDLLIDKLDRQIVKHKEKIKDKHPGEAPKRISAITELADEEWCSASAWMAVEHRVYCDRHSAFSRRKNDWNIRSVAKA